MALYSCRNVEVTWKKRFLELLFQLNRSKISLRGPPCAKSADGPIAPVASRNPPNFLPMFIVFISSIFTTEY